MKVQPLESDGARIFAVVFDIGDEVATGLKSVAAQQRLLAAHFMALGAFERATLAWWNWDTKECQRLPIAEQVEVLSLVGNIAADEHSQPIIHAHCVVGKSDGSTRGGHLLEGIVRPTLEVMITETPGELVRRKDPRTGLALIAV